MDDNGSSLKNFLEIPYDTLEEMNLEVLSESAEDSEKIKKKRLSYLQAEKRIKAVTLCFTDLEGRLHMLDYDKNFFVDSHENLTFDGSSVRGYSALSESDLRLDVDWHSIRFLPSDVFGAGKVIFFANVLHRDRVAYPSDMRAQLASYSKKLLKDKKLGAYASAEIEGFLVNTVSAEQNYREGKGFDHVSQGGYYHSLPQDPLRVFIDTCAEAQRALGFRNEKDHPEVAPSQFEMNFSYSDVLTACDNIQLYKLVCRQVARNMGYTATFLPKPTVAINGSGMHINFSLAKSGKNVFYDKGGKDNLSKLAWDSVSRVLNHAPEMCLVLNPSVNSYRRLDPNFEAPNQIKVSAHDRGSMIRIPEGNEKSARIEVRSVAPDANPYMVLYSLLRVSTEGDKLKKDKSRRERLRFLPSNINAALRLFKGSDYVSKIFGDDTKEKYYTLKQTVADRSPSELGVKIKRSEIIFHHEVTNQVLWNDF